jgi:hypothetical protein
LGLHVPTCARNLSLNRTSSHIHTFICDTTRTSNRILALYSAKYTT